MRDVVSENISYTCEYNYRKQSWLEMVSYHDSRFNGYIRSQWTDAPSPEFKEENKWVFLIEILKMKGLL